MTVTSAPALIRPRFSAIFARGPTPRIRRPSGSLALRLGVVTYVGILVGIPVAVLVWHGARGGPVALWRAISTPTASAALLLTAETALLATFVNAIMGTIIAWVLVRYRFPGRNVMSALIDLPFAIPTLVAGMMLVILFGPQRTLGALLERRGVEVLFTPSAIVLALLFVTVPFVIRAIEPVLLELDPAEEEAARTLGASHWMTFRRIVFPAIAPAMFFGSLQCLSRALAEFGSIVLVAGNIPGRTLTAPVLIYGEVESGHPETAAAISLVLFAAALILAVVPRALRGRRPTV